MLLSRSQAAQGARPSTPCVPQPTAVKMPVVSSSRRSVSRRSTNSAQQTDLPVSATDSVDVPADATRNKYKYKYSRFEALGTAPPSAGAKPRTTLSPEHRGLWQTADAVCFDVDCTVVRGEGLDLLAEFMGVGPQIEALTKQALEGTMSMEAALEERLRLIDCTPTDVRAFLAKNPPESRLNPGIERLIKTLQARGINVYLLSGGFRELMLPIAKYLNIPFENVFANRMNWQWDDETGEPTKLSGFDMSEPTAGKQGKPEAIARIREQFPYNSVVMVGDGITDLEAVQVSGGADLFIGYGGFIQRDAVMAGADWFVYNFDEMTAALQRYKVAMVGSGSFACAAMHVMSQNINGGDPADMFCKDVKMWVHESDYEGRKLTEVINEKHESPKYLPGVSLGERMVAVPDVVEAITDADVIVFCAPHQFMHGLCKQMMGKVKKGAIAISLTKGMRVRASGPQLVSQMITKYLGVDCSVLMGANIAKDIGNEELGEAVIGYYSRTNAKLLMKLFDCEYFNITLIGDAPGAEMCGTLKNIVAIAAGMVDGLGFGNNSKAAILRQGLGEMRKLSKALYPTVRDETFLESCGVADLIATCYGGRNRLVAEAWMRTQMSGTPKTFEQLETELLAGQKLQGVLTSDEVQEILVARGWEAEYPLFTTTNRIIKGLIDPRLIVNPKKGSSMKLQSAVVTIDVPVPGAKKKASRNLASVDMS